MAATAQPSAALAAIVPADEDQHEEQENGAAGNDGNENVSHGVLSGPVSNLVRLCGYPNHKRPAKNRNHGPLPACRLLTIALDQMHGLAYIIQRVKEALACPGQRFFRSDQDGADRRNTRPSFPKTTSTPCSAAENLALPPLTLTDKTR